MEEMNSRGIDILLFLVLVAITGFVLTRKKK